MNKTESKEKGYINIKAIKAKINTKSGYFRLLF